MTTIRVKETTLRRPCVASSAPRNSPLTDLRARVLRDRRRTQAPELLRSSALQARAQHAASQEASKRGLATPHQHRAGKLRAFFLPTTTHPKHKKRTHEPQERSPKTKTHAARTPNACHHRVPPPQQKEVEERIELETPGLATSTRFPHAMTRSRVTHRRPDRPADKEAAESKCSGLPPHRMSADEARPPAGHRRPARRNSRATLAVMGAVKTHSSSRHGQFIAAVKPTCRADMPSAAPRFPACPSSMQRPLLVSPPRRQSPAAQGPIEPRFARGRGAAELLGIGIAHTVRAGVPGHAGSRLRCGRRATPTATAVLAPVPDAPEHACPRPSNHPEAARETAGVAFRWLAARQRIDASPALPPTIERVAAACSKRLSASGPGRARRVYPTAGPDRKRALTRHRESLRAMCPAQPTMAAHQCELTTQRATGISAVAPRPRQAPRSNCGRKSPRLIPTLRTQRLQIGHGGGGEHSGHEVTSPGEPTTFPATPPRPAPSLPSREPHSARPSSPRPGQRGHAPPSLRVQRPQRPATTPPASAMLRHTDPKLARWPVLP